MVVPYPFPIARFPGEQGLERLREAASAFQFPFLFVVAQDQVLGWRFNDAKPFFEGSTRDLLGSYTSSADEISTGWVSTLTSLARAWMSDLQWGWRSRGDPAPGEAELRRTGAGHDFLNQLRADEPQPAV
jgi:hypothetical protein